jgi:hypothetical protein
MASGMSELTLVPAGRRSGWAYADVVFAALLLTVAGTALAAYNVGPVPIQWLAQFLVFATVVLVGLRHLYPVPGSGLFVCIFAWALVVTLGNALLYEYGRMMPELVTSSYPLFIALRFIALLSFAAAVALVYWLLREGYRDRVVRAVVVIGTLTAGAALYIYIAQIYGWWEPGRTRLGTGGAEQAVLSTYAFHRAMGTFREPSHLAEWLVVPFFLCFITDARWKHVCMVVIGAALLLTGSLTGIIGVTAGLLGAVALTNPFRGGKLKAVLQVGFAAAVAVVVFNLVVVGYSSDSKGLFAVLMERIEPILWGEGMASTNRSYAFDYVAERPVPLAGVGLGHANLVFSAHFGLGLVGSFVSLYFNHLHSAGIVGLALLLAYLGRPVVQAVLLPAGRRDHEVTMLLAAYLGWLVMFAVHSEELSIMFGVVFALLVFEVRERTAGGRRTG